MAQSSSQRGAFRVLTLIVFTVAGIAATAAGQTFRSVYSFGSGTIPSYPSGPLALGSDGSLYGTSQFGGSFYNGAVYQLTPPQVPGGAWTETVIHSFDPKTDGCYPYGGVVMDKGGNLYGATDGCPYGAVFKLKPPAVPGGKWTELVLHNFTGMNGDGAFPFGRLWVDPKGVVYGTTNGGGLYEAGTVFRLQPQGSGFVETVLYSFGAYAGDGLTPIYGVTLDASGNVFGTTVNGGANKLGVVFELTPPATGTLWNETLIRSFGNGQPSSELILDKSGNIFGTSQSWYVGSTDGIVYRLTPPQGIQTTWQYKALWNFPTDGSDGFRPYGIALDPTTSNLWGTTYYSPTSATLGCGVVYELLQPAVAGGDWQFQNVHTLDSSGAEGCKPTTMLLRDGSGNWYGSTSSGGSSGTGTIIQVTPQ